MHGVWVANKFCVKSIIDFNSICFPVIVRVSLAYTCVHVVFAVTSSQWFIRDLHACTFNTTLPQDKLFFGTALSVAGGES